MRKERVYISGQMKGLKYEVYKERFEEAARLVRQLGYEPVSPTKFWICRWKWMFKFFGYERTLLYDLWKVMNCDRIYLIPGWKKSRGSMIESFVAYHFHTRRLHFDEQEWLNGKMNSFIKNQIKVVKGEVVNGVVKPKE